MPDGKRSGSASSWPASDRVSCDHASARLIMSAQRLTGPWVAPSFAVGMRCYMYTAYDYILQLDVRLERKLLCSDDTA